jgi:hypothetical protein
MHHNPENIDLSIVADDSFYPIRIFFLNGVLFSFPVYSKFDGRERKLISAAISTWQGKNIK